MYEWNEAIQQMIDWMKFFDLSNPNYLEKTGNLCIIEEWLYKMQKIRGL